MNKDRDYYRQRLAQETAAAQAAACPIVSDIHRDLADRYSEKLRFMETLGFQVPPASQSAEPPSDRSLA